MSEIVLPQSPASGPSKTWTLDGYGVLLICVCFFGVIFAVNGVFAYRALSTYTGEIATEPYRKGLAYNDRIIAGDRQAALGWVDVPVISRDGKVLISIRDARGMGIDALTLDATLGRPATNRQDRTLSFSSDGAGKYVAHTTSLESGTWMLTLKARQDKSISDPIYQARRRLWLAP